MESHLANKGKKMMIGVIPQKTETLTKGRKDNISRIVLCIGLCGIEFRSFVF